jgi:hypothetical protein
MQRRGLVVVTVVVVACLGQSIPGGKIFDPSSAFSLKKNPSGDWQYGYSADQSFDSAGFRLDQSSDGKAPIGFWHPATNQLPGPGYYPYVAFNTSKKTEYGSSNGWAARAGQVAMEGSNTGQYSILRFTAPVKGEYEISAGFEGIHFGLSTTDVHVLHNNQSLFDADIEGYGGDPAFHAVEGAHSTAEYSGKVDLKKHDTIDFVVGYGKNKTHFGDTTGLFAKIRLLNKK